jgi:hypothetical protein
MDTSSFVEVHQITKTFTHKMTLDQSGSGSAGKFVLDITGKAYAEDQISVTGPIVISGSGTLTSDVEYHLSISGQYSNGVFTATSQSYSETGSATANYAYSIFTGPGSVASGDADITHTWDLLWSASVTNGALSFTTFSNTETREATKNWGSEDTDGDWFDRHLNEGITFTATGSGTTASYTGREWLDDHSVTYTAEPYPGTYYYDDDAWDNPLSGTDSLDTTPMGYDIAWNALDPAAVNYTWHGETEINDGLDETARWTGDTLDVTSFLSNSSFSDEAHLIETDQGPDPDGTGQLTYSTDETRRYVVDAVGSGSYVGGVADADYFVSEEATFNAESGYEVTDDHSSGTTEEGEPYDLTFNYYGGYTGGGIVEMEREYHEDGAGVTLTGSTYTYDMGGDAVTETSGTRNGAPFATTDSRVESDSGSFSLPGSTTPISPAELGNAYPFADFDGSLFLVQWVPPTTPPTIPGVPHPGGGLRPGATLLQGYYNNRIQKIGEDAKLKLGKMFGQVYVMQEVRVLQKMNGTFMVPRNEFGKPPGGTYAQAVGQWKKFAEIETSANAWIKKNNWSNTSVVIADVEMKYYVQPAPAPGQNRSGKCVVEWRYIFTIHGTKPNGTPGTHIFSATGLGGNGWFEDDNLKTMNLNP